MANNTAKKRFPQKHTAMNRADLLVCLAQCGESALDRMAFVMGYQRLDKPAELSDKTQASAIAQPISAAAPLADTQQPVVEATSEPRFYHVVKHIVTSPDQQQSAAPDWFKNIEPIKEPIRANPHLAPPAMLLLTPWARLWPFLRQALGATAFTRQLDVNKVVQQLSRGQSLCRLPYRRRIGWAVHCQIIVDHHARVLPFWEDFNVLCQTLLRLRGFAGLDIVSFEQGPMGLCRTWGDKQALLRPYRMPVSATPVLILSDLACLDAAPDSRRDWLRFGLRLKTAGIKPVALMPCPQRLWDVALLSFFIPVCWDRGQRLSCQKNRPPVASSASQQRETDVGAELLLTLLSPAIRVEPALLRAARYLLPADKVDVGSEAAAWLHKDVITTRVAFSYTVPASDKYRDIYKQNYQQQLSQAHNVWAKISLLIKAHHRHLSPVIIDEEQRNFLLLTGQQATKKDKHFLRQLVKTLFEQPWNVSLWSWAARSLFRQHSEVWSQYPELGALWIKLNQSLSNQLSTESLPKGLDLKQLAWAISEGKQRQYYHLRQVGQLLMLEQAINTDKQASVFDQGSPIVDLSLLAPVLQYQGLSEMEPKLLAVDQDKNIQIPLPEARLQLITDHDELTIDSMIKPHWASAIGRDALGLFVEFAEGEGKRRAYWVNPGLYPVKNRDGAELGFLPIKSGYFQDEQQFRLFVQQGFMQPDWADEIGLDDYGLYVNFSVKGVSQIMRWIMPGRFMMGSPESEAERIDDELLHEVILTKAYWLADTACTQALWQAVMGENPSEFKNDLNPVENVSWDAVQEFINHLNEKQSDLDFRLKKVNWKDAQQFINHLNNIPSGLHFRLPTEAEWEYACRAGTTTPFSFGENITPEQVNYNGEYPYAGAAKGLSREQTVKVKALPCHRWGLYQMHGNVWEWCADGYAAYPNRALIDPQGPDGASGRVLRGGGWFDGAWFVRSADRDRFGPGLRDDNVGLRLARGQ